MVNDIDDSTGPAALHQGSNLREMEHAWCRLHSAELGKYSGEWVILEGERVVSHGKDPSALISEARRQGIRIPYIFRVAEANENVATIGL